MTRIARLTSTAADFEARLAKLLAFEAAQDAKVERAVAEIIADVRARGDAAVLELTRRFDRVAADSMRNLEVSDEALDTALAAIDTTTRSALEAAAARVRVYHERQRAESWQFIDADGTLLGQRVTPIARVGVYVPGGRAAYPSTVLMNVIPAKVAGVGEIIMTVPTPGGERSDLVLAAAKLAGVNRVFTIGGAQAVAALAYGTAVVPKVDKIVGPGNAYVAAAKRRVFGEVGIDMIAGPSEVLIICDATADPDWIAMDLFAQAEHDAIAQSIAISTDASYLDRVAASIERLLPEMPRRQIIEASLANRGALVLARDDDELCQLANQIAPEHLELAVDNPERLLDRIRHAGAIFLGRHSSEALGDYCAGPNHVLPTAGTARFSSPLGVYDFQKRTSLIGVSRRGADKLGRIAGTLARGEGLSAHARAVEYRLDHGTVDKA